jgi:hypothetical protein
VTSEADSKAPVCEAVARAPTADRPDFRATIGFERPIARAKCADLRGLPKRLQVQQDDVGARIRVPVAEQVVARNVRLVAHRYQTREAQLPSTGEVDGGQTECPTLGGHADPPGEVA